MTYPARGQTQVTAAWLGEAVAGLKAAGIEPARGQHRRHARPVPGP